MLSKKHRFYGQGAIRYINRKGRPLRSQLFTVKRVPSRQTQDFRVAVVVSKKVAKSAPRRNRIRRRIYEVIRTDAYRYAQGSDIVIVVFSDKIATMDYMELKTSLVDILKQR